MALLGCAARNPTYKRAVIGGGLRKAKPDEAISWQKDVGECTSLPRNRWCYASGLLRCRLAMTACGEVGE